MDWLPPRPKRRPTSSKMGQEDCDWPPPWPEDSPAHLSFLLLLLLALLLQPAARGEGPSLRKLTFFLWHKQACPNHQPIRIQLPFLQ